MRRTACVVLVAAAALLQAVRAQESGAEESRRPRFLGVRAIAIVAEHLDGLPFRIPQGVHYDPVNDEVFVVDSGNGLIGIHDGAGVPKFTFSSGHGQEYPVAVETDPDGNIYVLSAGAPAIAVFNYRGEPLHEIPLGEVERERVLASGMGISPDGRLFVLDGGEGRIVIYRLDGALVRVVHGSGRAGSRLQAPYDIAFDANGDFYVTDRRGLPVQVYDASGRYLRGWGRKDIGAEDFSAPSGLCVDSFGFVMVADPLRQDVKVFDREGVFQDRFGGFGGGGGEVAYPTDVGCGRAGRVYVVERVGRRLQVFDRISLGDGPNPAAKRGRPTRPPNPAPGAAESRTPIP